MHSYVRKLFFTYAIIAACPLISMQMPRQWKGRAIAMAYDRNTQEWNILLAHNKGKQSWSDFAKKSSGGQQGNQLASQALKEQTNNVYESDMIGVPWRKSDKGDFFHFVHVRFKPGSELYRDAKNNIKDDFIWVPASKIINQQQILHKGQPIQIPPGLKNFLRHNLPDIIKQLDAHRQQSSAGASSTAQGTWGPNKPNHLYFYSSGAPYYEFTNFYAIPGGVTIGGENWPTTEHYFQAQKFPNWKAAQDEIRRAPTPRDAFTIGRSGKYAHYKDPQWDTNKYQVMKRAVKAKFSQNEALKKLLLGTGNQVLVEDAGANDADWGAGADYNGGNNLGRILMEVRDELAKEKASGPAPSPAPQENISILGNKKNIMEKLENLLMSNNVSLKADVRTLIDYIKRKTEGDNLKNTTTWERVLKQIEQIKNEHSQVAKIADEIIHLVKQIQDIVKHMKK